MDCKKNPPSPAVMSFTSEAREERNAKLRKIMDDAAKLLEAEGVKYFIGVLDRQPLEPDQGKAFCQSDVTGDDFVHILDMALPSTKDVANLGIYVGTLLNARNNRNKKS